MHHRDGKVGQPGLDHPPDGLRATDHKTLEPSSSDQSPLSPAVQPVFSPPDYPLV